MSTISTTFFGGLEAMVELDHSTYRGVTLDKATIVGKRGGKSVAWRAASKREHQMASYHSTRDQAARVAAGYDANAEGKSNGL